jgi:holin-like protein
VQWRAPVYRFGVLNWFTLILACQLAGETAVAALGAPLPGPVVGMALLFVFLLLRKGIPDGLARTGDLLLSNLSLLFVPAGVGVMAHGALIARDWPALSVSLIGSTLIAIAVTALAMVWLKRLSGKGDA